MFLAALLACSPLAPSVGVSASPDAGLPVRPAATAARPPAEDDVPATSPGEEQQAEDPVGPLAAVATSDVTGGAFPLAVAFASDGSALGSGEIDCAWDFGDGAVAEGCAASHTYGGAGAFTATLTLTDRGTGLISAADVAIDVVRPACPVPDAPVQWGTVDSGALSEISGVAGSLRAPGYWWVEQDSGNPSDLTVIDDSGATVATWVVGQPLTDFEDLQVVADPATGISTLFMADIGDNGYSRSEIAIYLADEPDPLTGGAISPLKMRLTYPDGARNAETLLVDPLTLDLYIVTKTLGEAAQVYVKRAPHAAGGPFVLEDVGTYPSLSMVATGGDVSPDGSSIVVRDYTATARVFPRDAYLPFEASFDPDPCDVAIHSELQGEAVSFTDDGLGLVTISEGGSQPIWFTRLD